MQGIIINDSLKSTEDGPAKLLLKKKAEEIDSIRLQTIEELNPIELKFVLDHPKSFVTPYCLLRIESREVISLDSVITIFNGLDNSVRNSRYGKSISEDIRRKENSQIGAQAPDFKATDLNQKIIALSQFKGKSVVLLDFWASWCVPCRESMPNVKLIYNKYHSKGFEVIAVSTDMNREDWIEAVKQDNIDQWYNIQIAEKGPAGPITNDDILHNYYNRGVPEQILIDKNGIIIGRWRGQSKDNDKQLENKLESLF